MWGGMLAQVFFEAYNKKHAAAPIEWTAEEVFMAVGSFK